MIELSGGVIGGSISGIIIATVSYFSNRDKKRLDKAEKLILKLCSQVEAYYEAVNLYAEKVHSLDGDQGSPRTVLIKMREAVVTMGFSKPDWSAGKAKTIREQWE